MDVMDYYFKGGALMHAILACSLVGAFVAVERHLALRKARLDVGQFVMKLRSILQKGDVSALLSFCSQKDAPIANIIRRGIIKVDQGNEKVREAIEYTGREEVYHLEKHLWILASVAGVAPMLGFLGTVTGLISAFQAVQNLRGVFDPADLAAGIWPAMITTAFGLFVGIPALAMYKYYVTRVGKFVHEMDVTSTEFFELLERRNEVRYTSTPHHEHAPQRPLEYEDDEFFRKKA
jgi:biopolymer transport protein ExbB